MADYVKVFVFCFFEFRLEFAEILGSVGQHFFSISGSPQLSSFQTYILFWIPYFFPFSSGHAVQSCSVMSDSLWPHGLQPATPLCPWDSPGRNTGVGCHTLLQGIFPTQGSKPGLPHWRQILYRLSHQGSLSSGDSHRMLDWKYWQQILDTFFRVF